MVSFAPYNPPESEDEPQRVEIRMYRSTQVDFDDEVVVESRKTLRSQVGQLNKAGTAQRITYTTEERHGRLGRMDDIEKRIDGTSRQIKEISRDIASFDGIFKQVSDLKAEIRILKKASNGYLDLRRRWLDSYKRDYSGEEVTTEFVNQGIMHRAHEADIETDAFIFEEDRRINHSDQSLFIRLYVFDSRQVQALQSRTTSFENLLKILNQRATAITQGHEIPGALDKMFTALLRIVEDAWCAGLKPDFSNPADQLKLAYSSVRKEWDAFQSILDYQRKRA